MPAARAGCDRAVTGSQERQVCGETTLLESRNPDFPYFAAVAKSSLALAAQAPWPVRSVASGRENAVAAEGRACPPGPNPASALAGRR